MMQKFLLNTAQRVFEYKNKNGRLLMWLAKGQLSFTHISGIRDSEGEVLRSPSSINERFLLYYQHLYSSRVEYTPLELDAYLDRVIFPMLDDKRSLGLESNITLEQIQVALLQLQVGKTPGVDGLLNFTPIIRSFRPRVLYLYLTSFSPCGLLVLKSGKDPEDCSSYRQISLINVDAKI